MVVSSVMGANGHSGVVVKVGDPGVEIQNCLRPFHLPEAELAPFLPSWSQSDRQEVRAGESRALRECRVRGATPEPRVAPSGSREDQPRAHNPAALYQHLPAEEAWRLTRRFEWMYRPKHASWLNLAELEWSALQRQCLGQHLAGKEIVEREIHAWETDRNARLIRVNWQFSTTAAARRNSDGTV
ncbi:transposase [Deinococcus oregonensis]|uniref:Transposase n=1 Tax=Deinococcus oregonensis TaxID=1805970 RepID=A0ABV6B4R9_9DEIO